MGDFETYKNGEEFSVEMISYISQHVRLPPKVREDAGFVRDTCHEEIILFKLWRPMVFNPFRRPACIVGETFYPEVPKWLGKDLAYFTGYGSKEAANFVELKPLGAGIQLSGYKRVHTLTDHTEVHGVASSSCPASPLEVTEQDEEGTPPSIPSGKVADTDETLLAEESAVFLTIIYASLWIKHTPAS
ncbi:hypothetical protein J6590_067540 [Homalodisca vitripennis]|nr:hypothetical protein J6590_067540 [Homalodisca vitripennis]